MPESHNVQKRVEDAQIVRFCQVETEADNLSIGVMEKRIWANAEDQKIMFRST